MRTPARARLVLALAAALALQLGAAKPPLGGDFARSYRVLDEPVGAPDYAFYDAEGNPRALIEYQGRVVVAMFWATWCGVCAREVPKLDALQARLGDERLEVIALARDGSVEEIRAWYAKRGVRNLAVYRDPDALIATLLGIRGVPTTFVIDKRGLMVGVVQGGAGWDTPEAEALLRHYLSGDGP